MYVGWRLSLGNEAPPHRPEHDPRLCSACIWTRGDKMLQQRMENETNKEVEVQND